MNPNWEPPYNPDHKTAYSGVSPSGEKNPQAYSLAVRSPLYMGFYDPEYFHVFDPSNEVFKPYHSHPKWKELGVSISRMAAWLDPKIKDDEVINFAIVCRACCRQMGTPYRKDPQSMYHSFCYKELGMEHEPSCVKSGKFFVGSFCTLPSQLWPSRPAWPTKTNKNTYTHSLLYSLPISQCPAICSASLSTTWRAS